MHGQPQNSLNDDRQPRSDNVIAFSRRTHHRTMPTEATRGSTHQTATLIQLWEKAGEHDGLDGVPLQVLETLGRLEQENRPGALCVLRLNEYRLLEETFGRHIGLVLMQRVGDRLRHHLRGDDLLAQIADDEFMILLDGQQENSLLSHIAERLLRDCTGTYTLEGLRMHVNGSLGIARFPLDATEPGLLMRFARIALHETTAGSLMPYHFFTDTLLKKLQDRVWLATELEQALEEERFELHYQPLFDIATQRIQGAEALLRLRTEGDELIFPDRFIPLAEELGLIVPIGRWVVTEACQQLKRWHQQGHDQLRIAVNVSPVQLVDENFVDQVIEAVENAGIAYSDLELEITESRIVEYLPLVEQAFQTLSAMGVRIEIDDFGTGYSALAYLTRLHWRTVKIDRAFLAEVPHDANATQVVSAIIAMAGELGLEVTAEGVETEAQYRFLVEAGCHKGQGFGYAHPQPATDFSRLLQTPDGTGWHREKLD